MDRTIVKSSNIQSVGHNADVLEVEFKNGAVFHYIGVPRVMYDRMLRAQSIGAFFAEHIKGAYRTIKVPRDTEIVHPNDQQDLENGRKLRAAIEANASLVHLEIGLYDALIQLTGVKLREHDTEANIRSS